MGDRSSDLVRTEIKQGFLASIVFSAVGGNGKKQQDTVAEVNNCLSLLLLLGSSRRE